MNRDEFFEILQKTGEGQAYLSLIEQNRGRSLVKESGYEIHHILPVAMGGNSSADNLVKLTTYEHLLAHYYLVQSNCHPKALYIFSFIIGPQFNKVSKEEQISLEQLKDWAILREKARHRRLTPEHAEKISKALKGRKLSEKQYKQMSDQRKGWNKGTVWIHKGEKGIRCMKDSLGEYLGNGWKLGMPSLFSERIKAGIARKPKRELTEEEHQRRSALLKARYLTGWQNPRKGLKFDHESDWCQKLSNSHIGKKQVHKDGVNKWVASEDFSKFIEDGWKAGFVRSKKK